MEKRMLNNLLKPSASYTSLPCFSRYTSFRCILSDPLSCSAKFSLLLQRPVSFFLLQLITDRIVILPRHGVSLCLWERVIGRLFSNCNVSNSTLIFPFWHSDLIRACQLYFSLLFQLTFRSSAAVRLHFLWTIPHSAFYQVCRQLEAHNVWRKWCLLGKSTFGHSNSLYNCLGTVGVPCHSTS